MKAANAARHLPHLVRMALCRVREPMQNFATGVIHGPCQRGRAQQQQQPRQPGCIRSPIALHGCCFLLCAHTERPGLGSSGAVTICTNSV